MYDGQRPYKISNVLRSAKYSLLCRMEVEDWAVVGDDLFELLYCSWGGACNTVPRLSAVRKPAFTSKGKRPITGEDCL